MAKTTFFGSSVAPPAVGTGFDFSGEYPYQESLMETGNITKVSTLHVQQFSLLLCHGYSINTR